MYYLCEKSSRGIEDDTTRELKKRKYGQNTFDIPVPEFGELFKEHAVAPFFVFQMFCVVG